MVRENLLIRVVQNEIDGEAFYHRANLEAAILPITAPLRRTEAYRNSISFLLQGRALKNLMTDQQVKKVNLTKTEQKEIKEAALMFKVLKHTSFYDRMDAIMRES